MVSGDRKDLLDVTLNNAEAALHVTQKSGSPYSFHIMPDHWVKAFSRPNFLTPTILISLFDRPMLCQGVHTYKWITNECTWAQLRTLVGKTGRRRGQLLTYAVIFGEKPDSVICKPHLLSLLVMWPWFLSLKTVDPTIFPPCCQDLWYILRNLNIHSKRRMNHVKTSTRLDNENASPLLTVVEEAIH